MSNRDLLTLGDTHTWIQYTGHNTIQYNGKEWILCVRRRRDAIGCHEKKDPPRCGVCYDSMFVLSRRTEPNQAGWPAVVEASSTGIVCVRFDSIRFDDDDGSGLTWSQQSSNNNNNNNKDGAATTTTTTTLHYYYPSFYCGYLLYRTCGCVVEWIIVIVIVIVIVIFIISSSSSSNNNTNNNYFEQARIIVDLPVNSAAERAVTNNINQSLLR